MLGNKHSQVMSITNGPRARISPMPTQQGEASTKRTITYIDIVSFSRLLVPVSKSFVLSVHATTPKNPLAMQIKPCISSKTFQSVPNSRSQDMPKFTASNRTYGTSQDMCQNLQNSAIFTESNASHFHRIIIILTSVIIITTSIIINIIIMR